MLDLKKRHRAVVTLSFSQEISECNTCISLLSTDYYNYYFCGLVNSVLHIIKMLYYFINSGCCSYIGYIGCGKQGLSLSNACIDQGTVVHEILHTMGFFHEHSRPDRDQYVRIIDENIRGGANFNFDKLGSEYINSLGIEYDYNSIMHYCENAFSVDPAKKKTIITLEPNAELCNACELSPLDILQINLLYECG